MPTVFGNKIVVTQDELIPQFYNSYNTLAHALSRAEKRGYGIQRVMLGGNGRVLLIDYDTLPRNIKNAIPDPRKVDHILERYYINDALAVDWYSDFKFEDGTYIDKDAQQKYVRNASMLNALIALKNDREAEIIGKGGSTAHVMVSLCNDAISFNDVLENKLHQSRHSLPENYRRFNEKFNAFQRDGYKSLVSKLHKNKNAAIVTDDIRGLLNNIFGTHKPNYTEVAIQYAKFMAGDLEIINNTTGELYSPDSFKPISRATIYNILAAWENRIVTHSIRSGDRQKFMAKYKPYHSLERPKLAGSIISVDDRQPPFEYAKGQRAWFYNAIDLASEAFTTSVYGKTKEGIILDFYRQMVRNYAEWGFNLPAEIECESNLNSMFANTILKEGNMFQYVRIEANNARGKRIEQYYRPLRYNIEREQIGWLARPFALSEANQASGEKVPTIPYDELIDARLTDIETWNNMPHSVHTDKTRWEVFCEMQNPNLRPTNYKAILPYIGYTTDSSCNLGIVKLQRSEWLLGDNGDIYTGERLINLMKLIEGREIEVRWLDANDGSVLKAYAYHDGNYICELLPKPTYNRARIEWTDADLAKREIMSSYVATIEGFTNHGRKQIDQVTILDHTKKTLNDKFKINGLRRHAEASENETVEILPPAFDYDLNYGEPQFKQSLKDRF